MPGKKQVKKAKSEAQARFLGAVAGGAIEKPGLSKEEAKKKLKGVKVKSLPEHIKKSAKKY